eukprot:TRINITY_DN7734_c0_g1_i1.p1 TRINITY_DN7734_c0_g1~~TRINITY_DN7734_c0_g1_i1.p1  ORF type:complete len:1171 (-),score=307.66 TRINITY_DN7734_c0_g1_i1:44-3556(-)
MGNQQSWKNAEKLEITSQGLTQQKIAAVKIGNFKQLTELNLDYNAIDKLPPGRIGKLVKLKKLFLNRNQLTSVPLELGNCAELVRLELGNNLLVELPEGLWEMLCNLEELSVKMNKLTSIPREIGWCSNLRKLILYVNRIKEIPEELGLCTALHELDLGTNHISHLPQMIGNLTSLYRLNINSNKLTHLTPYIETLHSLEYLDLRFNRLSFLPPEIAGFDSSSQSNSKDSSSNNSTPTSTFSLNSSNGDSPPKPRVKTIYLNNNRLVTIPGAIANLSETLTCLTLDENEITSLPPEIGRLTLLSELSCRSNKLRSIPVEFTSLRSLSVLDLSMNELDKNLFGANLNPNQLKFWPRLQKLYLNGNKLTNLPASLGNWENLAELECSDNQITSFPVSFFSLPTTLGKIDLRNNKISSFPPPPQSAANNKGPILERLWFLDLGRNRISKFPTEIFQMTSLFHLSMWDNFISTIPPGISSLTRLKTFHIAYNTLGADKTFGISHEISSLVSLQIISIQGCALSSIPECLYQMPWLREVYLSNNDIKEVSKDIAKLNNLHILDLTGNLIKSLPDEIHYLENSLAELELSHNKFTGQIVTNKKLLGNGIGDLKNLTELDLSGNYELESLQTVAGISGMSRMGKLRHLKITQCFRLRDLSEDLNCIISNATGLSHDSNPLVPDNDSDDRNLSLENETNIDGLNVHINNELFNNDSITSSNPNINSTDNISSNTTNNSNNLNINTNTANLSLYSTSPVMMGNIINNMNSNNNNSTLSPNIQSSSSPLAFNDDGHHPSSPPSFDSPLQKQPKTDPSTSSSPNSSSSSSGPSEARILSWISLIGTDCLKTHPHSMDFRTDKYFPVPYIHPLPLPVLPNVSIPSWRVTPAKRGVSWSEMRGSRPSMEDTIVIHPFFRSPHDCLLAVFDGHRGPEAAEFAATLLSRSFSLFLSQTPKDVPQALYSTFKTLERKISAFPTSVHDSGCTALVVFIDGASKRIYSANAGDSRCVYYGKCKTIPSGKARIGPGGMGSKEEVKNGVKDVKRMSVDHNGKVWEERERIQNMGGYVTEKGRVMADLAVSRSLGDKALGEYVTWEPWIETVEIEEEGGGLVVMGCDGLWDVMSDEEAGDIVKEKGTVVNGKEKRVSEVAAVVLRDFAYLSGSTDNISVIVADVGVFLKKD